MKKILLIPLFILGMIISGYSQDNLFYKAKNLPCANKTFKVAFHVVKPNSSSDPVMPSESDINAMLVNLNLLFEPICFNFVVGEYHIIDNYNYSIISLDSYNQIVIENNSKNRINVYIVDDIDINAAREDSFSEFEGVNIGEPNGIVIEGNDYLQLAHGLGRFFGLLHTFDNNVGELVDGSTCTVSGDMICDTPPDPYVEWEFTYNYVDSLCRFKSDKVDPNGVYYEPDTGNIMSIYVDCWCGFTYDQYKKMYDNYTNSTILW